MGWRPEEVRRTSLRDFHAAYKGWARWNGIEDADRVDPPTRAELEELIAIYG